MVLDCYLLAFVRPELLTISHSYIPSSPPVLVDALQNPYVKPTLWEMDLTVKFTAASKKWANGLPKVTSWGDTSVLQVSLMSKPNK